LYLLHSTFPSFREKIAEQNRARQAREIASNSDWFGQSTAFDSLMQQQQHQQQQHHQHQQKMRGEPREDLPQLLSSQGLAKYTDIFLRHEIDLPTFSTLTDDELKEIGISTFGKPATFVVFWVPCLSGFVLVSVAEPGP
jgi:hypothetical protein